MAANLDDKTPTRRRRRQKPSLKEYLTSDSFWMNESVKRIDEMLKWNAEEIKSVERKKAELNEMLKWNVEEMKSVEHKKTKLISFRQYVLDCGAEERKDTTKWEQCPTISSR